MTVANVGLRFDIEGGEKVRQEFRGIGETGDSAAKRLSESFERAGADIAEDMRRLKAATSSLMVVNPAASVTQREAARSLRDYRAEQLAMAQAAETLRRALDPVYAAKQRFNSEIRTARQLLIAGNITLDEYNLKLQRERAALEQARQAQDSYNRANRGAQIGLQQAGFQVQDFLIQVNGGTSAIRAFSMQAPQMIGALQLMSYNAQEGNTRLAAFARFMSGGWGVAFGVAIPLVAMLAERLLDSGEAADTAKGSSIDFSNSLTASAGLVRDYAGEIDQLTQATRSLINTQALMLDNTHRFTQVAAGQLRTRILEAEQGLTALPQRGAIGRFFLGTDPVATAQAAKLTRERDEARRMLAEVERSLGTTTTALEIRAAQEAADPRAAQLAGIERERARLVERRNYTNSLSNGVPMADAGLALITKAEFDREYADLERRKKAIEESGKTAREAESARRKAEREAEVERKKAEREAEAAARKLASDTNTLIDQYVGGRAEVARFNEELAKVGQALSAGLITGGVGARIEEGIWQRALFGDGDGIGSLDERMDRMLAAQQEAADKARAIAIGTGSIAEEARRSAEAWEDLRDAGLGFIDTVLSPEAWSSWGNIGKTIVRELQAEFMKLALINPIKNFLFDGGLPTLGTLFGGKPKPGSNASGTEYWGGGLTWVGENGKELLDLPRGSKVYTAADSRRMAAAGGGGTHISVYAPDVITQDMIVAMIRQGMQAAAVQGAAGGAAIAQQDIAASGRRRLGRRW